jgi:HSP20 family protein
MTESDWTPMRPFLDLQREIDEVFGALIDEPWGRRGSTRWLPAVDIDETAEAYLVTVDLPGVCADDVQLHVRPREVEIRGTRVSSRSVASATRIHTERSAGHFRRTFPLDHPVDPETAESRCQDGVYQVKVKKRSMED